MLNICCIRKAADADIDADADLRTQSAWLVRPPAPTWGQ